MSDKSSRKDDRDNKKLDMSQVSKMTEESQQSILGGKDKDPYNDKLNALEENIENLKRENEEL